MRIRFTGSFANNWSAGDEVEAVYMDEKGHQGYLIDKVALIDICDFNMALERGIIQIIKEDVEQHMMNPCMQLCYNRFHKSYTKECDNTCEYAHAVAELKKARAQTCSLCKALYENRGKQPSCTNCTNNNCGT